VTAAMLDALASWVEARLDLDSILAAANAGEPRAPLAEPEERRSEGSRARIGVARDAAFSFYYPENLDMLARLGAEIVEFSPVADARLPDGLDGLYLGGGYPELLAAELSRNERMRADVRAFARSGRPVYAECGGFMYLTEAIVDADGREHAMVGVFPTRSRLGTSLAAIAYREITGRDSAGWLRDGERARGHEFRYSSIDPMPGEVERWHGSDGFRVEQALGSYVHLHFASCPSFAERFVDACARRTGSVMRRDC
jgi:cobyrinic acid a,c-diamide synthase